MFKLQKKRLRQWLPRLAGAVLVPVLLFAAAAAPGGARADDVDSCAVACSTLPAGVTVDPASYKLWAGGARSLLDTTWSPESSVGVLALLNSGASQSPTFMLSIRVENHDPISEAVISAASFSYAVPALDPGQSLRLGVPLDYTQCNIYLIVAPDSVSPTVLRTGDPAAC